MRRILVDMEGRWVGVQVDPPDPDEQCLIIDWDRLDESPELALSVLKGLVTWSFHIPEDGGATPLLELVRSFIARISDRRYLAPLLRIPQQTGWWARAPQSSEPEPWSPPYLVGWTPSQSSSRAGPGSQPPLADPDQFFGQDDVTDLEVLRGLLTLIPEIRELAWNGQRGAGHLVSWSGRPGELIGLALNEWGQVVWTGRSHDIISLSQEAVSLVFLNRELREEEDEWG